MKPSVLRRYPLTFLCVLLIWYLCLFKPPHTSLDKIHGIDKMVHFLMYLGTCSVFWCEYLRHHERLQKRLLTVCAVIVPILMSGLIELVQTYCTTTRSGEWADFAANSCGVLTAAVLALLVFRRFIHPHASSL